MDSTILAALIAAIVAACAGITNFFMTIHRNKQDGIIKYRMEWIENVRNEYTTILGWEYHTLNDKGEVVFSSFDALRNAISKVALYMNVRDDYDSEILKLCYKYKNEVEAIYNNFNMNKYIGDTENNISQALMVMYATESHKKSIETKNTLLMMIRVYLKTEWTRVKVDSSISIGKFKYWYCWRPFKGFLPDKALSKFKEEYISTDFVT